MGFWSFACRSAEYLITAGGSKRIRSANELERKALVEYEEIRQQALKLSNRLTQNLQSLAVHTERAFKHIQKAQKMLRPLQKQIEANLTISVQSPQYILNNIEVSAQAVQEFFVLKAAAKASVAGTAIGVGSWTAVSLLGFASTGISIATLHGAAATSATLAWFGGGSLITGGLGMAGGTFVLGGIVFLPIIGLSAWLTHSKAKKIEQRVEEIQRVNKENRCKVKDLQVRLDKVEYVEPRFKNRVDKLSLDIERAKRKLRRFGWFSHVWRKVRSYFVGYYYDQSEMAVAEQMAISIEEFLSQFSEQRKLVTAKANA